MIMSRDPYTLYFAGDIFDLKHLAGNILLSDAIHRVSENRYECFLPQDLEQRTTSAHEIRDNDIRCLAEADGAVFNFDGTDLDSGTVVEFMVAKFLDIPSVIIRTDFRVAGDQEEFPWNLMAAFYPRTVALVSHSMAEYQAHLKRPEFQSVPEMVKSGRSREAIEAYVDKKAGDIVAALDQLMDLPSNFPSTENATEVFRWFAKMCGFKEGLDSASEWVEKALERKRRKRLVR